MSDKGYLKLIGVIKTLAEKENNILIGIMKSGDTCQINDLVLEKEDYYIAEHLITGYIKILDGNYSEVKGLKQNDIVLLVKLNDDKYVIIERLVE